MTEAAAACDQAAPQGRSTTNVTSSRLRTIWYQPRTLAVAVAMAVAWRSNAQQAGSQDLATVAGSEVRPSLRGWFSGTGGAGWFWGEN